MMGNEIEGEESVFSAVALVDISDNGRMATAFVTDTHEDGGYTVFIPTGPNPTSGTIYHLKREHVYPVDLQVDVAMKTVVGCGAGSSEIINTFRRQYRSKE